VLVCTWWPWTIKSQIGTNDVLVVTTTRNDWNVLSPRDPSWYALIWSTISNAYIPTLPSILVPNEHEHSIYSLILPSLQHGLAAAIIPGQWESEWRPENEFAEHRDWQLRTDGLEVATSHHHCPRYFEWDSTSHQWSFRVSQHRYDGVRCWYPSIAKEYW
jgi:hypothetical protein